MGNGMGNSQMDAFLSNGFSDDWRKGWDSNPRGSVNPLPVFKTGALNHSATLPRICHPEDRPIAAPAARRREVRSNRAAEDLVRLCWLLAA